MNNSNTYPISTYYLNNAYITKEEYLALYKHSIENPDLFWQEQALKFITWQKKWQQVRTGDFENLKVSWFEGALLNASYNCLDRHLKTNGNKLAIIWEGDDSKDIRKITYNELHEKVCKLSNALKKLGINKGDKVCIYLPQIPEAIVAMLACARIGAVHSVVFSGFSANALLHRILDSNAKLIITADEGVRGGKTNPVKENVDKALKQCPEVKKVIVIKRTGGNINWVDKRDYWYHEIIENEPSNADYELIESNEPFFILYTSGSLGKPKGILHALGGYLVYVATTFHYIFNYEPNDIYWCSADIGWITGHSYLVYGPLLQGATTLMYEGIPNYPTYSRFWEIIDRHKVNIFYTSPTALRALRKEGDKWVNATTRDSLKLLGTVGEPINPDVWKWFYTVVGNSKCAIVDTWWQTETGGIVISPLPGATPLKPGSASMPFFGIEPGVIDDKKNEIDNDSIGKLIIKKPWPGLAKTIYNDNLRFKEIYFKELSGAYLTGDGAKKDEDGYYWITGRTDDVIKVSGHRLSSEELESALISHPAVAEAAVVPIPDKIKGEGIYAYIVTIKNIKQTKELKNDLIKFVRGEIGPIATIENIQWTQELPKTRSGKIMRRILKKIACNDIDDLGDTSTLINPEIINILINQKLLII